MDLVVKQIMTSQTDLTVII